jgi:hypothetical protein
MFFHYNIRGINVLKEDEMISSAFSVFPNVELSRRPSLEQQLHNRLMPVPCGPR